MGVEVVSMLAFNSDVPSSIPAKVFVKIAWKELKNEKEAGNGQLDSRNEIAES